jgi:hypothetical protein
MTGMKHTRVIALMVSVLALAGGAVAAPFKVSLELPEGLTPGKESTVRVMVPEDQVNALRGSPLAVVFDGRQNSVPTQVDLGKIGDKLEGKFTPQQGQYRVTLRFQSQGRNYAYASQDFLPVPVNPGVFDVTVDLGNPNTRASFPIPLLGWLLGSAALGLWALRGTRYVF